MVRKIAVVDAFTGKAFAGNPAGVCMLEGPAEDAWMQALAKEMAHSETAYLLPIAEHGARRFASWGWDVEAATSVDASRSYVLRWFTPGAEVNLCGHATLATARYLFDAGFVEGNMPVSFYTRSGLLHVEPEGNLLKMDFPAIEVEETDHPVWLDKVLPGVTVTFTGKAREDYFVVVEDAEVVRSVQPDIEALRAEEVRGMIVTAKGDQGFDAVSRFFAPGVGVDEDPVTGSAHCAIGPYWCGRLGKSEVRCFQASQRGGEMIVRHLGERVSLVGQAVTVLTGALAMGV
ncbi:PhzF family phenazine biosynthesis protein [bacterium]|nr:PhzF family phenazine biosynthesis protein [bacterium]